jgi:D-amino peptidase
MATDTKKRRDSMKRVFISADLEGIAGVVHSEHTSRDGREHEAARKLMTGEVNAAVEGALAGGAGQVVVNDSHGTKRNLIPEELHKEALLITGTPKLYSMMEGIQDKEGYHSAMFVGYHAAMGRHGVLSHTYVGSVVREVRINGRMMGETGINALVAGHFRVPVTLVTGDRQVCDEAAALLPGVVTAAVKDARGRYAACGMHPQVARDLIRERARQAMAVELQPLQPVMPLKLELSFLNSGQAEAASLLPGVEYIDPVTLGWTAPDADTMFRMLRVLINLAWLCK